MTQDEIIEMARQAGALQIGFNTFSMQHEYSMFSKELEAFAKLVAEREREACAKVADQISDKYGWGYYGNEVDTADEIAEAIRARGEA